MEGRVDRGCPELINNSNENWQPRLMARNLLGTETYQWLGLDTYTIDSSAFQLRPRQLFISLKRAL